MNQFEPYSPSEISTIRVMLLAGRTARQIAETLPGRSKNAIIGIVRRTPELRKVGFSQMNSTMGRIADAKARGDVERKPRAVVETPETQVTKAEPANRPVFLDVVYADLGDKQCQFETSGGALDAPASSFRFCGLTVAPGHKRWCAYHGSLSYAGKGFSRGK
jgi:hypothetical protein